MRLTDVEKKFSINNDVGVYPQQLQSGPSMGTPHWIGWEIVIVQGADIIALGRAKTREDAFEDAKKSYERYKSSQDTKKSKPPLS